MEHGSSFIISFMGGSIGLRLTILFWALRKGILGADAVANRFRWIEKAFRLGEEEMYHRGRFLTMVLGVLAAVLAIGTAQAAMATNYYVQVEDSGEQISGLLQYTATKMSPGQYPVRYSPPIRHGSCTVYQYSNFAFAASASSFGGPTASIPFYAPETVRNSE